MYEGGFHMSGTNSKNMFLMIVLFLILVVTFTYALVFNRGEDVIYTDIRDLEVER